MAALAAVSIIACGRAPGTGSPVPTFPPATPPTSALVPWQGFPAGQQPRPIVWMGNASPVNGFGTNEGKIAAMCNRFVLMGSLPKNLPPRAVATWTDGTTASFAGISAAAALAGMSRPNPEAAASDCASVPPLVIDAARLETFDFGTDRGTAQMTAWLFKAIGVDGEFAYPALPQSAFWTGGMTGPSGNGGATVSADGLSLTWSFGGAPENAGPCGADYRGLVAESPTAVAVSIQSVSHATPGDAMTCPAIAQIRTVTVKLASRLGGRVVVDSSSAAVTVCPAALQRGC
jgi:hypothetical protein